MDEVRMDERGADARTGPGTAMARVRRRAAGTALVALLAGAAIACSSTTTPTNASGGTTVGTATNGSVPGAVPTDYSKPGPYKVGTERFDVNGLKVVVYYPADPAATATATRVTSYSSGEAFGPQLAATVSSLVPAMVQPIPIDAYDKVKINGEGPFPLVIHSHGFGGFYLFASQHFQQEASWGFVVAAPEHPSRDLVAAASNKVIRTGDADVADLKATLDLMTKQDGDASSPLEGGIDVEHVLSEGHSAGGRSSYLFAAQTPSVKAWIGQAPAPPITIPDNEKSTDTAVPTTTTSTTPDQAIAAEKEGLASAPALGKPAMIVQGEKDTVVPIAGVQVLYDWLSPPKRLVVVANAGHASFLDICKTIREQGGLDQYASKLPTFAPLFKLGDDGCAADNIDPTAAYALINHVMIAQYRWVLGKDPTEAALDPAYLQSEFPVAYGRSDSAS
jgi:predicted dienelactone hydrolase